MSEPGGLLGDFVRVMHRLAPRDDAAREAIASCFGLEPLADGTAGGGWMPDVLPDGDADAMPTPELDVDLDAYEEESRKRREAAAARRPSLRPGRRASRPVRSEFELLERVATDRPDWLVQAEPLAAAGEPVRPPAPEPLLLPRWTTGILSAALATAAPDGPIDVEGLVQAIARREPLERLPRHLQPTLRGGAQVLVDLAEGMTPYIADEVGLIRRIRRVLGDDQLSLLRFAGCPGRGAGPGGRRTWKRYEPPVTPRPVVVVTDLGLGGPRLGPDATGAREWHAFARRVRGAGCPLVALVPYPAHRVPRQLRREFELIVWDRTTTAGSAAHAVRASRRR